MIYLNVSERDVNISFHSFISTWLMAALTLFHQSIFIIILFCIFILLIFIDLLFFICPTAEAIESEAKIVDQFCMNKMVTNFKLIRMASTFRVYINRINSYKSEIEHSLFFVRLNPKRIAINNFQ